VANLGTDNRFETICNDLTMAFVVVPLIAKQANIHPFGEIHDLIERVDGLLSFKDSGVDLPELG